MQGQQHYDSKDYRKFEPHLPGNISVQALAKFV